MSGHSLFVGSYTAEAQGEGTGITVLAVSDVGELLKTVSSVEINSPSFLAVEQDRLFAVTENADGRVSSFHRAGNLLTLISTVSSGGADPCHIAYDASGSRLLCTNYSSGSVSVVSVDTDLVLAEARPTASPSGSGPVLERQAAPHTHQSVPSSSDDGKWMVADLGIDRVLDYRVESDDTAVLSGAYVLPAGTGPRHLAWARKTLLVLGELDSRLHVMRRERGILVHAGSVSTIDSAHTTAGHMPSSPSHVEVSPDLRFAYVANRHRDTMSVFDLAALEADALPILIQETPCGGSWPRHFTLHGGLLYVANQGSNQIAVFETDAATGRIGSQLQAFETGSPSCLVFG